jgi:putative transposase
MDQSFSLRQAAEKMGLDYETFRGRKDMQLLAKSSDFILGGHRNRTKFYPLSAFPPEIQAYLGSPSLDKVSSLGGAPQINLPLLDGEGNRTKTASQLIDPDSKESRCLAAWLEILNRIQPAWCECKKIFKITECDYAFAAAVGLGEVEIDPDILSSVKWGSSNGISAPTIVRMRRKLKNGVQGVLRNLDRPKVKTIDANPQMRDYIISYIHNFAHANMTVMRRELVQLFPDVPSLSTITRWVEAWKADNESVYLKATNPDQWKNKFMVAFGSQSDDVTQPNQRWELDSTPADILLTDGRYAVIAVIDVYTRRANLLVSSRSKSEAIISLLRQTILEWGIPQTIKTDNGKDYTSNAVKNACATLAIWQELCPPYSPEKKPHVERLLGTFNHDWLPTLPGYAGHNVETRQAIRSQRSFADNRTKPDRGIEVRLNFREFQNACSNWVEEYNHRVHSSLNLMSPIASWNAAEFFPRRPESPRTLDMLLAFQGTRKVGKQGISFDGGFYISPLLDVGDRVQVSLDATDLGKIYVFNMQGEFVCAAIDAALLGANRQTISEEASQRQKAQVRKAAERKKKAQSQSNFKRHQKEIVAEKVAAKFVEPEPVVAKVIPLHQPQKLRLATPEELFAQAWEIFASGGEMSMTIEQCDRVLWTCTRGDCEVLLAAKGRVEQRRFLSWLIPFTSKEA